MADSQRSESTKKISNDLKSADGKSSASSSSDQELTDHRLKSMEDLLNEAIVQIHELKDKIEELEKEAVSQRSHINRLEEKVTELQHQEKTITTVESKAREEITPNTTVDSETKTSAVPIPADSEESFTARFQSVESKKDAGVSNDTDICKSRIESENKTKSELIADGNTSTAPEATTASSKMQIGPGKRVFARWMTSSDEKLSLWKNSDCCYSLIGYIGKIFKQHEIHHIVRPLRLESRDSDELDQLRLVIKRVEEQSGAKESLSDWQTNSRSHRRLGDLQVVFESASEASSCSLRLSSSLPLGEKIIEPQSIKGYFDLICRDGYITTQIGEYLQLKKEDTFGGDQYNSCNENFTFVNVNLDESTIELADNRVDLITCFVVLHHVPRLQPMLAQLVRILRPNGYLIIREHDCKNERSCQAKYLNFVHAFMMIARVGEFARSSADHINQAQSESNDNSNNEETCWKEQKSEIIQYTSTIQYRTRMEWKEELERQGFHRIAALDYHSREQRNPQALYYEVYQLSKN